MGRMRFWFKLIGCMSSCFLVFVSSSMAQEKGPELKAKFHQDFRGADPKNPNLNLIREGNFRWEAAGARVTMPARAGKLPTTGIAANFKIKGDFEITVSYEILKAEQPTEGYGVGVSIFVAIVPETMDAVSLARRVVTKGNAVFMSDRMKPDDGKVSHVVKTKASTAATGKLRIQRLGSMVRFLVAEGDNPDFFPVHQGDAEDMKTEVEFGADEIRYFQIGGDAGDSQSALDLRLLDLTVRADDLPDLIELPLRKQVPPSVTPPASSSNGWLGALPILGLAVAVCAVGTSAWYLFRRRYAVLRRNGILSPKQAGSATPATAMLMSCSSCGKKLKVKTELAGKRVKCPQCGGTVCVPSSS